jgi:hypothetical protein
MIPRYLPGEIVAINWRRLGAPGEKCKDRRKDDKFLFYAQVTDIYAKKLKEITDEEAIRDGIPDRKHLIEKLMEMHHLKSDEHYCFVIRFERVESNGVSVNYTLDRFVNNVAKPEFHEPKGDD